MTVTYSPLSLVLELTVLVEGGIIPASEILDCVVRMNVGENEVQVREEGKVPFGVPENGGKRAITVSVGGEGNRYFLD